MTKYSKIKKSTFAIIALSLILVAILSFGGTYAYFSASADAKGTVNIGTLKVSFDGGTSLSLENKIVVPNQDILQGQTFKLKFDETNIKFYLRIRVDAQIKDEEISPGTGEPAVSECIDLTGFGDKFRVSTGHTYYYVGDVSEPGQDPDPKAKPIDLTNGGTTDFESLTIGITLNKDVGKGGSTAYMGKTITITITVEVLQADYLESTSAATDGISISELNGDPTRGQQGKWDEYAAKAKE